MVKEPSVRASWKEWLTYLRESLNTLENTEILRVWEIQPWIHDLLEYSLVVTND